MGNPHAWTLAGLPAPWSGVRVMSTFACGGGSTMGYKRAGCDVVAANDIDPEMARHYKRNLSPRHYFLGPIKDLLTIDLPDDLFGIDILDGSPPCSTFSTAGKREAGWGVEKRFREGQVAQVLSDLFFDWIALVDRLRPRVAVAENVKGMIVGNARGYARLVVRELERIGYRVQLLVLNAADCGVPQRRERVFFVCSRADLGLAPIVLSPSEKWVSAEDATYDVQTLSASEIEQTMPRPNDLKWWPRTNPGGNYGEAVMRAGQPKKLWNHVRLMGCEPSFTLTSSSTLKHWAHCRTLTLRELVRLGSFPDDYRFESARVGAYMIGMSVPPKMMETIARAICAQWFGVQYGPTVKTNA